MKIALVISSLGDGGSQRVMSNLANAWARRGDDVTLITLKDASTDVFRVDASVARIEMGLRQDSKNLLQAVYNNGRRVRALRRAINEVRPDVVISFLTNNNILTLVACWRINIPVIISERISLTHESPRGIWRLLYRHVYQRAVVVVVQTEQAAIQLSMKIKTNVRVIPNPILIESQVHSATGHAHCRAPDGGHGSGKLMAMGRLTRQKGFDLLLEAFAQLAGHYPAWQLEIVGEGPERETLEAEVHKLGLAGRVILSGYCTEPVLKLLDADAFVLSSRHEGMPNALMEAMANGLPCVSFDCHTGPSELIEHDVDGILVPMGDTLALASALGRLMADPNLRARLGISATRINEKFSLDAVLGAWDGLFEHFVFQNILSK